MQTKHFALLSALLLVLTLFFANTKVYAAACDSPQCGDFNGNTIQFLETISTTCKLSAGSATPCTEYRYRYTGSATNQINVAIPKEVMTKFTSADRAVAGCSQLITDGSGDSTTGFGINLVTHNVCRVAITGSALSTPFSIRADPSSPQPDAWEVRQSSSQVFADFLLGPGVPPAPVAETAATLKTSEGVSVSYTNVGGQITVTSGTGETVPISDTKLCIFNGGSNRTFPANWTCETIEFATDQCDIKTTGGDPCRFIGGTCILY